MVPRKLRHFRKGMIIAAIGWALLTVHTVLSFRVETPVIETAGQMQVTPMTVTQQVSNQMHMPPLYYITIAIFIIITVLTLLSFALRFNWTKYIAIPFAALGFTHIYASENIIQLKLAILYTVCLMVGALMMFVYKPKFKNN